MTWARRDRQRCSPPGRCSSCLAFTRAQLGFLSQCVSEPDDVEGAIVEGGSAFGNTTVFPKEHMRASGIDRCYVCVDAFSGFREIAVRSIRFAPTVLAEEPGTSQRDGLNAVAHVELGEQAPQLRLDRVLADVEARGQLSIGHAGR